MSKIIQNPIPQAGAIPFRFANDRIEYCLITSTGSGRWVFPKGTIEAGDSMQATAIREAFEEAGLRGQVFPDPIGAYGYSKSGKEFSVTMFLLQVEQVEKEWMEASKRKRRWVPCAKANSLLPLNRMKVLLDVAHYRLSPILNELETR